MKSKLLLSTFAIMTVICGLASGQITNAEDKTTESQPKVEEKTEWTDLRDGLDDAFKELQKDAGIKPSRLADDHLFLRRVYLDLIGRPPSVEEIDDFKPGRKNAKGLKGQAKREWLIDQLLQHPEYNSHWGRHWAVLCNGRNGSSNYLNMLTQHLSEQFSKTRKFGEIVDSIIAVKGDSRTNKGVGYLSNFLNRRNDIAGVTSKVFLGKQIQCAECHDHPYEHWTTDDFEGMEAFFRLSNTGQRGQGKSRYWFIKDRAKGENKHDVSNRVRMKGKYLFPTYLGRKTYEYTADKSLRESFSGWMTSADNKWFREMTVNRYMAYFMGVGFVVPVDDFNSLNEPTFPKVLEAMALTLAKNEYDLDYLVKAICSSQMYQRESKTTRKNRHDRAYYTHQFVRRLTPEQIMQSVEHVVGVRRFNVPKTIKAGDADNGTEMNMEGLTEKQLEERMKLVTGWERKIRGYFRTAYGADEVVRDVDDYDGSIIQALMLMNADLLAPAGLDSSLKRITASKQSHMDKVFEIFTTVLGRRPNKRDAAVLSATAGRWSGGNDVYTDLFVALMNTTEFVTNH
ncbi:MAG: DUF1549 domain-containing protein [Planctomycetota bacterium]|jgi:hypothetical protein